MTGFIQRLPRAFALGSTLAGVILLLVWMVLQAPSKPLLVPSGLPSAQSAADYRLQWQSTVDETGRPLLPDEVFSYSEFLKRALSGQLAYTDPRRVEFQARTSLSLLTRGSAPGQAIRLQSRVRPKLVLRNHSLAVFEIETDYLDVRYSADYAQFLNSHIKTMTETVRVADTRLGLVVRHVERIEAPAEFVLASARKTREPERLGGINYYPASAPWTDFWASFPVAEINADFQHIRAMGANSVRVFLNRRAFEAPARREQSLHRLERLLDLAQTHDLKVILTCFDMGVSYELADLTQGWSHLQRILEIAERHPAVALIDLKNEPDLDYRYWGAARVDLWLSTLLGMAQATYPDLSFTIGWSNARAALALADKVDIVSFHDFEAPSTLSERLAFVRNVAGSKPVMLTEIGHSRWPTLPGRMTQAEKLSTQLQQVVGLDGVLVWTLNDFDQIPDEVAGWRPWRKAMQAHYGLSEPSREKFSRFLCDFLKTPTDQTCIGDAA
jgi:hypothetical protein